MPGTNDFRPYYNLPAPCFLVQTWNDFFSRWSSTDPSKLDNVRKASYWNSKSEFLWFRSYVVGLQSVLLPAQYEPIIKSYDSLATKYASGIVKYSVYTEDNNNRLTLEGIAAVKTWFDTYIKPMDLCKKYPPVLVKGKGK